MSSNHSAPPLKKANAWRTYNVRHTLVIGAYSLLIFLFYALTVYIGMLGIMGYLAGYDFYDETLPVPLWLTISALIPVIVTVWPVQRWIRKQVAHLLAWETSNPHALVNQLAQQIVTAQTTEQLMPMLVQQLATMFAAPYVAIETAYATLSAATGEPPASPPLILPLQRGAETLGHLHIAPRELAGMPVQFDEQLLADVTRQVSLTLWAVQLSVDLQASRHRIVIAREEERRRIRRDLHDGLGAGLATMTLQADTARELLHTDPDAAENLLQALIEQTEATIHELRQMINGLRPPILDDLGLRGALQDLLRVNTPTQFRLQLPATLPPLSAAVEVALYRIAQEGNQQCHQTRGGNRSDCHANAYRRYRYPHHSR
ncbi:MAG: hypothetical protein GY805_09830 [Chloroflexi bacterium]|nr:hypothetical protein [Chloroflexota bacterium]